MGGGGEYLDPVIFGAYMALLLIHYVASMLGGGGHVAWGDIPPFPPPGTKPCTWHDIIIVLVKIAAGGTTTSSATLPPSGPSSTGVPVPAATATAEGAAAAVTSGQSGSQGNLYADLN